MLYSETTASAAVCSAVEGWIDFDAGEGKVEFAGVEKILGKASDLAQLVGSDAAFVDKACHDFEGEDHFVMNVKKVGAKRSRRPSQAMGESNEYLF